MEKIELSYESYDLQVIGIRTHDMVNSFMSTKKNPEGYFKVRKVKYPEPLIEVKFSGTINDNKLYPGTIYTDDGTHNFVALSDNTFILLNVVVKSFTKPSVLYAISIACLETTPCTPLTQEEK